jgi:hypothetical protein
MTNTKVIMLKSSVQIVLQSLVMALALIAGRGMAQESAPSSGAEILNQQSVDPQNMDQQSIDQPAADEPVEMAALLSSPPELPEPAIAAGKPEASGFAFAPVVGVTAAPKITREHRFWDRENRILFSVAGGLAVADFCVTRANLASGGRELNPITRVFSGSTAGLATNFALETGGLIGVNYLLHKTGHHKLERITSYVNIGSSAGAVAWGLSHR